ncbi:MAG: AraC-like DNA-binding protein [Flavobacteriales bacterium]|jgi:AraC-like DNA-binding protein
MDKVLFNMHDVILLVTVYQCVLLTVLFGISRAQSVLSRSFAGLFFLFSAAIPLDLLILLGEEFRYYALDHFPNLFYAFEFGYWLQGPALLLYVRSLISPGFRVRWQDLIYISPFVLYFLHQVVLYHSLPTDIKEHIQEEYSVFQESYTILFVGIAREALRVYFGAICVIEINRYLRTAADKANLAPIYGGLWLRVLSYGCLGLWIVGLYISFALNLNVSHGTTLPVNKVGLTSNYLFCFLLGGVGLTYFYSLLYTQTIVKEEVPVESKPKLKINQRHLEKLEELMKNQKAYMNSALTREYLADQVGVSPRTLSNIIKLNFDCSFFSYINRYRVEEAKSMLISPERSQSTVLDIMYEVGFQNKATFNSMFKKISGLTPREYRKLDVADS